MGWWLTDLRRAVFSWPFPVAVGILVAVQALWIGPELLRWGWATGAFELFLNLTDGPWSLIGHIAVTIPFAQSYALERNSGFSRSVLLRQSLRNYQASRLVANALAGGLVLALPLAGAVAWVLSSFPVYPFHSGPVSRPPMAFIGDSYIFPDQVTYMWLMVAWMFLYGATIATAGLAVSTLLRNPYYANIVPFAALIVLAVAANYLGVPHLATNVMWFPASNTMATPLSVGAQYAAGWLVSLAIYFRFFRLKEE